MKPRFETVIRAQPEDIDELGHVNNATWIQWVQKVATEHWEKVATPEQQQAYVWVVTRHEVDYLRPLHEGEETTARTWVGDAPRGARFDRLMEFHGHDGRLLVKARTSWAIIDRASGRPIRVPREVAAPFLGETAQD